MDMILVLDFGTSHAQTVARFVRSENVYSEVLPYDTPIDKIAAIGPKGLILAGGLPHMADAMPDGGIYALGVPILAFDQGMRAMIKHFGGNWGEPVLEDTIAPTEFMDNPLFEEVSGGERWFKSASHIGTPPGFATIATANGVGVAIANMSRNLYALQFYPESNDPDGLRMLYNFSRNICQSKPSWNMDAFIEIAVRDIQNKVGDGKALLAMSGGVDSAVCAALMHKAIGKQLYCFFVDTGLMRKNEGDEVERAFSTDMGLNFVRVDARERFLGRLRGVTDPEEKRRIIGEEFIRVFEDEAKKLGQLDFLVQGTIYPDIIESYGIGGSLIKSHHNVGGLPEHIGFKDIIEPLAQLFKDEVREVGETLGMTDDIVYRQPFPGPGLSVRVIGEVTEEKLCILRNADAIFREEIKRENLHRKIWQYFVVLTDMRSTGIADHARSYEHCVVLRAVHSINAMTASAARLPYDLLARVVERITTEVEGVNRVLYDITSKPPATIEFE